MLLFLFKLSALFFKLHLPLRTKTPQARRYRKLKKNNYKLYYFRRYYLAKSIVCQRANCFVGKIEFLCKFFQVVHQKLNWFSFELHCATLD